MTINSDNLVNANLVFIIPNGGEFMSSVQVDRRNGTFDDSRAFTDLQKYFADDSIPDAKEYLQIGMEKLAVERKSDDLMKVTDLDAFKNAVNELHSTMTDKIELTDQIRSALMQVAEKAAPFYKLDVNSPDALTRGMRGIDGKSLASLVKGTMRDAVEDRSFAEQLQKDTTLWKQLENVSNSYEAATALHGARSPNSTHTIETSFAVYADIRSGDFLVKEQVNDNAREVGSESTIGREKLYEKAIELIDARMQQSNTAGIQLAQQLEVISQQIHAARDGDRHPFSEPERVEALKIAEQAISGDHLQQRAALSVASAVAWIDAQAESNTNPFIADRLRSAYDSERKYIADTPNDIPDLKAADYRAIDVENRSPNHYGDKEANPYTQGREHKAGEKLSNAIRSDLTQSKDIAPVKSRGLSR